MTITVHGLKEATALLSRAAIEMPVVTKAVDVASATKVSAAANAYARSLGSTAGKVASVGGITSSGSKVTLNTGAVPYARGAEYGSNVFHQFKPTNPSGYFLTPTITRLYPAIEAAYATAIAKLFKAKAGLGGMLFG